MAHARSRNKYVNGDESDHEEETDSDEEIDIHEIVRTGTLSEVKENLAKDRPKYIALKDEHGRTVLHYAAMLDRVKIALHLIAKNANVNAKDKDLMTPLHYAAANGLTDMCRFLLDFNANIRLKDTNCWTAVHHAVDKNHYDTVTLLLKRNGELNVEDHQFGRTPLHLAAERGFSRMCEMLIIRGADLYASGDAFYSKTPLHIACIQNHLETMHILIQRGSALNMLSGLMDKAPLHIVCELGYLNACNILLAAGADVNVQGASINGNSPLHLVCEHNFLSIADLLLQHGADLELQGRFTTQGTPLHVACTKGHVHITRFLLDNGAKMESVDSSRHTPLHMACLHGHYDMAIMMIEERANFRAQALNGKTPIDYIKAPTMKDRILIICGKIDKMTQLEEQERVRKIEEAKELEKQRQTLAAERRRQEEEVRQQQLARTERFCQKMLAVVTVSGEYAALLALLQDAPDQDPNLVLDPVTGGNALTLSAQHGFYDQVKLLLNVPVVRVDFPDAMGNTALHFAAASNCRDAVEELLLSGANNALLNAKGQVPANCTSNNNIREILRNPKLIHSRAKYRDQVVQQIYAQGLALEPGSSFGQDQSTALVSLQDGVVRGEEEEREERAGRGQLRLPQIGAASVASSVTLGDDEMLATPRREGSVLALPAIPSASPAPRQSKATRHELLASPAKHPAAKATTKLQFDPYNDYPEAFTCSTTDFFAMREQITEQLRVRKALELSHELNLLQCNQLKYIKNKYEVQQTSSSAKTSSVVHSNLAHNNILINNAHIHKSIYLLQFSYLPDSFDSTMEFIEKKNLLYFLGYPYRRRVDRAAMSATQGQAQRQEQPEVRGFLSDLGDLMDTLQEHVFTQETLPSEFFPLVQRYGLQYYNLLYLLNHFPDPNLVPPSILSSDQDKQRCCALASVCLSFVEHYLRFYDDVYINSITSSNQGNGLVDHLVFSYFEQIRYLASYQYMEGDTALMLCKLLTLCHLKNNTSPVVAQPQVGGAGEGDDDDDDDSFPQKDPLKHLWSEVILNPPRAMRQAADLFYELAVKLIRYVEGVFPQDVVRAHVWYFKYCQHQQRGAEAKVSQKYSTIQALSAGQPLRITNGDSGEPLPVSALSLWLFDLHLVEYEEMFLKLGFKLIEDFQGLNEDDCFRYFPFLSVGDRRRLCKHCTQLTLHMVTLYKRKAAGNNMSVVDLDTHSLVTV